MKAIRVQYTVQEGYVEQNKANIRQVMEDLKAFNNPNIKYSSFLLEDGKTFMHFAMYPDEETAKIIGGLESFKKFRMGLKASEPEAMPNAQNLSLVGSSYDIFEPTNI